jgi:hypothetical protein
MANLAEVEVYANDTKPYLMITLDDGAVTDPQPVDLTDVMYVLIKVAENFDSETNKFVGECEVVGDPAEGTIRYKFKEGELTRGGWIGEISLVYNSYEVQTMGHFKLKVKPDLPNNESGY